MNTKSNPNSKAQYSRKSVIVQSLLDGSLPAELQARRELGASENECTVTMPSWCGNLAVMLEVGPLTAMVSPTNSERAREDGDGDETPVHQVLLRSVNPRYQDMVRDIIGSPCLGLGVLNTPGLHPAAALVLLGEQYSVALCFDPFSPTYRQMLEQWKLTGQLCVRFENPLEGYACTVFNAQEEDAQALDYLLALDMPSNYQPDLVKSWLGMQAMERRQLDPNTLFLLLMEEGEMSAKTLH
jgi:hypothetical protein